MPLSEMLRRLAVVRTDVSEALNSSKRRFLTRATRRNIPEDGILHSHRRENLKSYIVMAKVIRKYLLRNKDEVRNGGY
jgi:hypothetical protein